MFHSQTQILHSYVWNHDFVQYFYRLCFFANQALKCIGSCWLYGYFQWKGGHLLESDIVVPFSVIAASVSIMDQLSYFVGGSVGPQDHRGWWLANTTISSNLFCETHVLGRPFVGMPHWCPPLDSDSLGGKFQLYDGLPAMDFSLVSNVFLQSCSALHKNDFYKMARLWLDPAQKKGNKMQQQLFMLNSAYRNFIVPDYKTYQLQYDQLTTILNPPAVLQKIDTAPFDFYSKFIASRGDDTVPLTMDDWTDFAKQCLELIAGPIIAYHSGVQTSRGGRPFAPQVVANFKNTLSQYQDNYNCSWSAVFYKDFWEYVSGSCLFRNEKDFVEIITRISLSEEQCPTSFPGWKNSDVRTFTFKARHKFPASLECVEWCTALEQIRDLSKQEETALVIPQIHSTDKRMFEKSWRFWNLV